MGGLGSGRSGGRPTVESALALDVRELFRTGVLQCGSDKNCRWTWTNEYTGETTAEVVMCARLSDLKDAHIRLIHQEAQKTTADYRVNLEATAQSFGGERWWFRCPQTHHRVAKLHLPSGAVCFASRHAYRLAYYTQRASPRDRAVRRMHKMRKRLGLGCGLREEFEKPLRMRWETFDREMAKLNALEMRAYGYMAPAIERLRQR